MALTTYDARNDLYGTVSIKDLREVRVFALSEYSDKIELAY